MALLMWSGGCDSTLVLAERLKAKKEVRTISIVQSQFYHNEQQRRARKMIVAHYKRRKIVWPHVEVVIQPKYPFDHHGHIQMGGMLPGIWLGIAMPYLDKDEDFILGYIKGDNAIHCLEAICRAFLGLQNIAGRNGTLELPLERYSKAMVIDGLKKYKLLRKCWWCEGKVGGGPIRGSKRCGKCAPCMTHKTAELVLRHKCDFKLHGDDAAVNGKKAELSLGPHNFQGERKVEDDPRCSEKK